MKFDSVIIKTYNKTKDSTMKSNKDKKDSNNPSNAFYVDDITKARDVLKRTPKRSPADIEKTRKIVRRSVIKYENELAA